MRNLSPYIISVSALLLLQGCSTSAPKAKAVIEPEGVSYVENTPAPTEPVEEDSRPELVRVITEVAQSMDAACFAEVYETLYTQENGGLSPVLAAGEWEHLKGEKTYLIPLLSSVSDSEGKPFTAEDAALCYNHCGEELLTSAEVSENGKLLLTFKRELLPYEESSIFCTVPLFTGIDEEGREPRGTGPYRVSEQDENGLTLLPNEYFRGEREEDQRVKEIRYLFLNDAPSRVIALEIGKADMADCLSYEDAEDFLPGGSYSDLFTTVDYYSPVGRFLLPDVSKNSALASEELRLALFSMLDCEALAEKTGGRACTFLGNPDSSMPVSFGSSYQTEVPDAESVYEALRKSGYNRENLTLLCPQSGAGRLMAEHIRTLWESNGVSVLIRAVNEEEYDTSLSDTGQWDLALVETKESRSITKQWQELWALGEKPDILRGGQSDATLLNLLQTVASSETATEENLLRLQERVYNHGFALALPQLCEPRVIGSNVKTPAMNDRGALLPGSCEYEKGDKNGQRS